MNQNLCQTKGFKTLKKKNVDIILQMSSLLDSISNQENLQRTPINHKHSHDFCSQTSTQSDEYSGNLNSIYKFNIKLKTTLCRNYVKDGSCPYEQKCQFAHGQFQLKTQELKKNNYKTKLCSNFSKKGYCSYGSKCNFNHFQALTISNYSAEKYENFGTIIRQQKRQKQARVQKQSRLLKILSNQNQSLSQIQQINKYYLNQNQMLLSSKLNKKLNCISSIMQ